MTDDSSVSQWIAGLKAGEAIAAQQLWSRYSARLVELARQWLRSSPRRVADEEDVVLSAFRVFCQGATEGRFNDLNRRDELWWLLLRITRQKAIDQLHRERAEKRSDNKTFTATDLAAANGSLAEGDPLAQLVADEPTPEFLVLLSEQYHRLLTELRDDRLREIALLRIEGFTSQEISERLHLGIRTVQRKIELIEKQWRHIFYHDLEATPS